MESPSRALTLSPPSPPLPFFSTPSRPCRNTCDSVNSPEFEFWNSGRNNPESIHSADELFSDGFLLPLYFLPNSRHEPDCFTEPGSDSICGFEPGPCVGSAEPSAHIASCVSSNGNPILNASKRWREIFKRGDKKMTVDEKSGHFEEIKHEKVDKRRENGRKNNGSGSGSGSAELNINLWPFSRSRSAGNNTTRSSKPVTSRKVSSAPCSRSNSSGESKSSRRSWPGSPARVGVHLGRASPVWQVKRPGSGHRASTSGIAGKGKVDVPVCVGNRQRVRCGGDANGTVVGGGGSGGARVKSGGGNGNLFGFRGLFSKKNSTVVTV